MLNSVVITLGQALAETVLKEGESGKGEVLTNTSHSSMSGQTQELFTSKWRLLCHTGKTLPLFS